MKQLRNQCFLAFSTRTPLISFLAVYLASGCAWIDPHPRAPELYNFKYDSSPIKFAGNLPNAIDAAIAQRKLYASRASEMSILRSTTAITVGAVTVPALYLGIHAEKPDAITALSLAGASALGLASYFDSRPRQRLYYAASRTVGCAIAAMTPFLIPESEFITFTDALTKLGNEAANVESSASAVESATAVLTSSDEVMKDFLAFAKAQAASARLLLERSNGIIREGNRLKSLVDRSGPTLRTNVLDIVDKVDDEIVKTESDPQSLVTLLSGLQTLAKQITRVAPTGGGTSTTKVPDPSKAGPQKFGVDPTQLVNNLKDSLTELQSSTAAMVRLTVPVSALINQVAAAKEQVQDIKSCQPPEAQTNFAVIPDDDVKEVQAPATLSFLVTGNVNAPRAHLTNQSVADATVDIRVRGGIHEVEVNIGKNAKTVDVVLLIQNGNDLGRKSITLRIKEAPKQQAELTGTKQPEIAGKKDEVTLTLEQFKVLQRVVGLRDSEDKSLTDRVDGRDGRITRDAIAKYKTDWGGLGTGSIIDKRFYDTIVARSKEALPDVSSEANLKKTKGSQSVFEGSKLPKNSEALKDIQRRLAGLGAKETGEYDEDLRKAIVAYQKSQNRLATGILGEILVAAIKNTTTKTGQTPAFPSTSKVEPTKGPDPEALERTLTSDDRKAIQRTLAAEQKMVVPITGEFKAETRTAIKAYQKKANHSETGFLTKDEAIELLKREPAK
jgi:peptidoglycan hydrolase-like protein with peptidoglycan-binding domain